ncbi:hypothetical protein BHE74_00012824 [Ensete ventricosum]|nr:hypothetical protein BHE74_00012824 [Ensete ventricosum]
MKRELKTCLEGVDGQPKPIQEDVAGTLLGQGNMKFIFPLYEKALQNLGRALNSYDRVIAVALLHQQQSLIWLSVHGSMPPKDELTVDHLDLGFAPLTRASSHDKGQASFQSRTIPADLSSLAHNDINTGNITLIEK